MAHASGSGWNQFYHLPKLLDQGCTFKPTTATQTLNSREVNYPWGHLVWGCLMYFFHIAWGYTDFGRSYFPKMLLTCLPIPLALLIIRPWHPSSRMMEFISSPLWTLWLSQKTEYGGNGELWLLSLAYKNAMYFYFVLLRYLFLEPSYHATWKPTKSYWAPNQQLAPNCQLCEWAIWKGISQA